jgi:hypothetical protein
MNFNKPEQHIDNRKIKTFDNEYSQRGTINLGSNN